MPLLDHFRPPFTPNWLWGSFHSMWSCFIARELNGEALPADWHASSRVQLSNDSDVAPLDENGPELYHGYPTATSIWQPPVPTRTFPIEFPQWEWFGVDIYRHSDDPELRATIEFICPSMKVRPVHRWSFANYCAAQLERGAGLVIVDIITNQEANLHADILESLELNCQSLPMLSFDLYAVAYRTTLLNDQPKLQIWEESLKLGERLPTVPLWLDDDLCIPLDLEATYSESRKAQRIPEIL